MARTRLDPKVRTNQLLDSAIDLAQKRGYEKLTRDGLAAHAGVSQGLVGVHFGTMTQLRRAVVRRAIRDRLLDILAQALAANDPVAKKAPEELRRAAVATLA